LTLGDPQVRRGILPTPEPSLDVLEDPEAFEFGLGHGQELHRRPLWPLRTSLLG
jgi:hypothetical protein